MPAPQRSAGGIRYYTQEHVDLLNKIKQAKDALGFSLQELQHFLALSNTIEIQKINYKQSSERSEQKELLTGIINTLDEKLNLIEQKASKLQQVRQSILELRDKAQAVVDTLAAILIGIVLLALFIYIELHTETPMFHLELFKIRAFAAGNLSLFLSSIARGGLQFMLIIWLQGIWLPLHGYSFEQTPLWAGIYMLPMMLGFFVMGPISGYLSDRFGARGFATAGMLLSAVSFVLLTLLPANFNYLPFVIILLIAGIGMGMFAAPNTTAIMNTVPPEHRGASSGMRATLQNTGSALSMTLYFSILIMGLTQHLPTAMYQGLINAGVPAAAAQQVANLPPTGALFAAFLGYNPMAQLLPAVVLQQLPQASQQLILGQVFFPELIAPAVMSSLRIAFYISTVLSLIAALASFMRGQGSKAFDHGEQS